MGVLQSAQLLILCSLIQNRTSTMYVHIYLLCFRYKAKEFRESMLLRKYNKGVSLFKSIFICITNIFDQAVQLGGC